LLNLETPSPMAANIALRCDMDLSPGNWKSPRNLATGAIRTMLADEFFGSDI
jgi:hypothetical protein